MQHDQLVRQLQLHRNFGHIFRNCSLLPLLYMIATLQMSVCWTAVHRFGSLVLCSSPIRQPHRYYRVQQLPRPACLQLCNNCHTVSAPCRRHCQHMTPLVGCRNLHMHLLIQQHRPDLSHLHKSPVPQQRCLDSHYQQIDQWPLPLDSGNMYQQIDQWPLHERVGTVYLRRHQLLCFGYPGKVDRLQYR